MKGDIEALEPRRMFAATPLAQIIGNEMLIMGTRRDDEIIVSINPADATRFRVTRNGEIFDATPLLRAGVSLIRMDGRSGDDRLIPDEANGPLPQIEILGGAGDDTLAGGAGSDTLYGGAGDDDISGRMGNDTIFGLAGDDTLDGGEASDHVDGGAGDDLTTGQEGNDTLVGGAGDDTLSAGTGDDSLIGGAGSDQLDGGDGNDSINAGSAYDTARGGLGTDFFAGRYFRGEIEDRQEEDQLQYRRVRERPEDESGSDTWRRVGRIIGDAFF